jgi:hypothetical protein
MKLIASTPFHVAIPIPLFSYATEMSGDLDISVIVQGLRINTPRLSFRTTWHSDFPRRT